MKPVWWMAGVCIVSGLVAAPLLGAPARLEMLAGMIGPLAVAIASWVMAERTYRTDPERLTSLMITAFAGKVIFFGAYVAVALKVLSLRPVPFMASFTGYFIALHLIEALSLQRLFGVQASR